MSAGICENCNKEIEKYLNYCSWECQILLARKNGGKLIAPNNLPISCILADNTMLECEHGNHPDYKFPVEVEYNGEINKDLPEWDCSYQNETHALIYTDDCIALTLNECCYYMWRLSDGSCLFSPFDKNWKLTHGSLKKIKEYLK